MEKIDSLKSDGRILCKIITKVNPQLESISLEESEFQKIPGQMVKERNCWTHY